MAVRPVPVRQDISKRLREERKFRLEFFRGLTQNRIASQIRRLRKMRCLKQTDLKRKFHQSGVSRIEQANYSSWTYKTLLRMTEALDGVLEINIRPYEDVIRQYEEEEKEEGIRIAAIAKAQEANREPQTIGPAAALAGSGGQLTQTTSRIEEQANPQHDRKPLQAVPTIPEAA